MLKWLPSSMLWFTTPQNDSILSALNHLAIFQSCNLKRDRLKRCHPCPSKPIVTSYWLNLFARHDSINFCCNFIREWPKCCKIFKIPDLSYSGLSKDDVHFKTIMLAGWKELWAKRWGKITKLLSAEPIAKAISNFTFLHPEARNASLWRFSLISWVN